MLRFKEYILEEEKPVVPIVTEPIKVKKKVVKEPVKPINEPTNVDIS